MPDNEGVISRALRFERVADRLRGAAEFGERVEEVVRRIEAMHFEADAGSGHRLQQRLQPLDVRSLLHRMDKALVPQSGRARRLSHVFFLLNETAPDRPAPSASRALR